MTIPQDHPHWKRMRFKNNKVWMAVDAGQNPILEKSKVLLKYQLDQLHEYWVHPAAVVPLDGGEPTKLSQTPRAPKSAARKCPAGKPLTEEERQKTVLIYTDGACSGNPGPAGIGVVLRYKDQCKEISRHIGSATNNIAELEAIKAGLLAVKNRHLPVIVFTDSSYALGLLTQGWKAKLNTALVQQIRELIAIFDKLRFEKVKGHAGDADNERADQLAVKATEGKG